MFYHDSTIIQSKNFILLLILSMNILAVMKSPRFPTQSMRKSLMTLLSLDLSKPFKLIISSENGDEVLNKIQPFIYMNNFCCVNGFFHQIIDHIFQMLF